MSARKILAATRELLSKEGAWGQHAFAYDETDTRVPWDDSRACTWCLEGGLKISARRGKATRRQYDEACRLVAEELAALGFYGTIQGWNDRRDTTVTDVLALLDRARASAA